MTAMTTIQRALHKALEHATQPDLDHEFFGHWRETGADRDGPIKDLVWRRCTTQDKPLQGLVWMRSAVERLDWLSARNRIESVGPVVELVELMTLVLWERQILEVTPPSAGGSVAPKLPLDASLAACLIASAWLNVNVKIVLDDKRQLCALNVLSDTKPSNFGRDPRRAVLAEIGAYIDAYGRMGSTGRYVDFRQVKRQSIRNMQDPDVGVPTCELLQLELEQHRKDGLPDPMVLVDAGSHDGVDHATCLWLRDELSVPSFQLIPAHERSGLQQVELDKFNGLKANLARTLQAVFMKIHESAKEKPMERTKVFISYSHEDDEWLKKVSKFLGPLEKKGILDVWTDKRIGTGDDWRQEIDSALSSSSIAILLLSVDFANSSFIQDIEMQDIWRRHRDEGIWIYPILVRNYPWAIDESLTRLQIKLQEGKSLNELSPAQQENVLTSVAMEIYKKINAQKAKS